MSSLELVLFEDNHTYLFIIVCNNFVFLFFIYLAVSPGRVRQGLYLSFEHYGCIGRTWPGRKIEKRLLRNGWMKGCIDGWTDV